MSPLPDIAVWQKAADFAATAHAGQTSGTTEAPYIAHPARVALIVGCLFACPDDEIIAAALLHDVLEKTPITEGRILAEFGPRVAGMVGRLSKNSHPDEESYWKTLRASGWDVRLIKMADALDHLDCPKSELPERITKGNKALELAFSGEVPLRRAQQCLKSALESAAGST